MKNTKITFVIPAYGRVELLTKTLDSLIDQSIKNSEIIVVDDGSNPPLKSQLSSKYSNVQFIRSETNRGPAYARNLGKRNAHGDFICFFDSDDIAENTFAEKMIQCASEHNGAALCLSHGLFTDLSVRLSIVNFLINASRNVALLFQYYLHGHELEKEAFFSVSLSRVVFPTKLIATLEFDEKFANCEDWDYILRFLRAYTIFIVPERLVLYRFSGNSYTYRARSSFQWNNYDRVIRMLPKNSRHEPLVLLFRLYTYIFSRI